MNTMRGRVCVCGAACAWPYMRQNRLNGLAILCIEKDMLEHIDVEPIISDFASKNARMKCIA
ncbi:hypothetical protein MTR_7g088730 [Medicago truncatula]|uniref:Uncharacterized protein n=1 Tax=Medicago truncatula TaxID=3880 RepID=G7L4U2_MEDTR|nr:hypothetical protein MTR_7g088730 [Medicago truncatula]